MGNTVSEPQDWRYERKFVVRELTRDEIESVVKLHPAMFSEVYYERFVNNLYFDSLDLSCYFDTVDGLKERLKIRVRWYGDLFGHKRAPVLEYKIKDGLLGRKERFSIAPFALDQTFQPERIVDAMSRSEVPGLVQESLASLEISLLNRYKRKYFESANHKYRITLDSQLEFYQVRACNNTFLVKSVDPVTTVVELKHDPEYAADAARIAAHFPFRVATSSKYASGLEMLCLW